MARKAKKAKTQGKKGQLGTASKNEESLRKKDSAKEFKRRESGAQLASSDHVIDDTSVCSSEIELVGENKDKKECGKVNITYKDIPVSDDEKLSEIKVTIERKETAEAAIMEMEMESGEAAAVSEENSSDGVINTDEEGDIGNTSSPALSEVSAGEQVRRTIYRENLNKFKMVRTREGRLKYEVDLTEEEKRQMERREERFNHTHVGFKDVEASLIPSIRVNNNDTTNKGIIMRYVHRKSYKITHAIKSDFGRLDLHFDSYEEANKCLSDRGTVDGQAFISFSIPDPGLGSVRE